MYGMTDKSGMKIIRRMLAIHTSSAAPTPHGGSSGLIASAATGAGVNSAKLSWGSGLKGVLTSASVRDAAVEGQTKAGAGSRGKLFLTSDQREGINARD